MRPVERDRVPRRAAVELRDRDAERLALEIEEGVLDPADRLLHDRARALAGPAVEVPVDRLDRTWVAADDEGRQVGDHAGEAVGEPCESVTSDQPTSPWSVVALTKSQGRQPASQASVSSEASFTRKEDRAAQSVSRLLDREDPGVHVASCSPVSSSISRASPHREAGASTTRATRRDGAPEQVEDDGAVLVEGRSNEDGRRAGTGARPPIETRAPEADRKREATSRTLRCGRACPPHTSTSRARREPTAPGQASSPTVDPGRWRQRPRAVDGPRVSEPVEVRREGTDPAPPRHEPEVVVRGSTKSRYRYPSRWIASRAASCAA